MAYDSSMHPATFVAEDGPFAVERIEAVRGAPLPFFPRLRIREGIATPADVPWSLRGVTSAARYVDRAEKAVLDAASPPLSRAEATVSVLIPIKKSAAWWALPQDERRAIFEGRSRHIQDSLPYLPRIARRLYHSRELGEPFDFLTYFEFAPEHEAAFDALLEMLRGREEWTYVEREVEIRMRRT